MINPDATVSDEVRKRLVESEQNVLMSRDQGLFNRVFKLGKINDYDTLVRVNKVLSSDKVLTKPPTSLPVNRRKAADPSTCSNLFGQLEATVKFDEQSVMGRINIFNRVILCDLEVIRVIKVLLELGVSRDQDVTEACGYYIKEILRLGMQESITCGRVLKKVQPLDTYYGKIIDDKIRGVLSGQGASN